MSNTRRETDSLGVVEVQADKLWSQTQLALPVVLAAAAVALGELWTDGLVDSARQTATAGEHGASARTANPP